MIETKTLNISQEKMAEESKIRAHFGWEVVSSTTTTLTMKREGNANTRRLASLEKQYNAIKKPVPVAGIAWTAVGIVLLAPGILLFNKFALGFLLLFASIVCVVIGLVLLLTFFILLPNRKKMIKQIFDDADELSGNRISLPLKGNLKEPESNSFAIKNAVYSGELKI